MNISQLVKNGRRIGQNVLARAKNETRYIRKKDFSRLTNRIKDPRNREYGFMNKGVRFYKSQAMVDMDQAAHQWARNRTIAGGIVGGVAASGATMAVRRRKPKKAELGMHNYSLPEYLPMEGVASTGRTLSEDERQQIIDNIIIVEANLFGKPRSQVIKHPGLFRQEARQAGFNNTFDFARHVLNNPEKYKGKIRNRASLALRFEKMQRKRRS